MGQAFITIAIPFDKERLGSVNAVLESLSKPDFGNAPRPDIKARLDATAIVHYASFVAIDQRCPATASEDPHYRDTTDSALAHLLIEIAADGGVAEALGVVVGALGVEVEQILAAAKISRDPDSLEAFLYRHHWRIGAGWTDPALGQVFSGSPGMSVSRIRRERDLAEWIGKEIDKYRQDRAWWRERSPRQVLDRIRADVWDAASDLGDTKWAFVEEPAPCLPGDPANPWNDSGYNIRNPQALKALAWILNTLLWPLYAPLAIAWLFLSAIAWREGATTEAIMWSITVIAGLLAVVGIGIGTLVCLLRRREEKDVVDDRMPPSDQVALLMRKENFAPGAQNHMTTISRLKPGWLRRLTLRVAFVVVGSGRFVGAPGFLGKNGVIHFARWMRLPGTGQLLFWSNFDNTWESYVADFIADAPTGVTAIWSNCRGFPRSKLLFGGGANDRDRLVNWARRQQTPTPLWYSGYPSLTTARIRNNAAIRQGLASAESDADARDWLALFGSAPRPTEELDLTEIPTLVFGGLSGRPYGQCDVVQLGDDPQAAHAWLEAVAKDVNYGEAPPGIDPVVVVAIAASGLRKLEIPEEALATFPAAFQQGMWREWRARELGDIDDNAPARWLWGGDGDERRCDAVVLVYAGTPEELARKTKELAAVASAHRHKVSPIPLASTVLAKHTDGSFDLPRELFGFADGVSQPIIRGAPRRKMRAASNDLVESGEIVLGYPDNTGNVPPSPSIDASHDPLHYLPDRGPDLFRRRPEFSRYQGTGERDLGANGSFLVVRQLDQADAELRAWLDEATENLVRTKSVNVTTDGASTQVDWSTLADLKMQVAAAWRDSPPSTTGADGAPAGPSHPSNVVVTGPLSPGTDPRDALRNWLAARLVGRWQNGSSLVRNADAPATRDDGAVKPDNAFLFGAEDPRGIKCPFGAHIRRANPRDTRLHSTPADSRDEVAAVNRHRILRVGRAYSYDEGEGEAKQKHEGLLFMCLNADIERQFEFIQKTWILNRNIHGLEDEPDPLIARNSRDENGRSVPRKFTIPLASGPLRIEVNRDFVRVVGGGYFFLPSRSALRYLSGGVLGKLHDVLPGLR
jgi:deferrochelatase/peroxidase EfeB